MTCIVVGCKEEATVTISLRPDAAPAFCAPHLSYFLSLDRDGRTAAQARLAL